MEEIKVYLQILALMRQAFHRDDLSLTECGTIAMAAQHVCDDPDGRSKLARLERTVNRRNDPDTLSNACYLVLDMAYQDYLHRVQPGDEVPSQVKRIIEMIYSIREQEALHLKLHDLALTGKQACYPSFFRTYNAMVHATQMGE